MNSGYVFYTNTPLAMTTIGILLRVRECIYSYSISGYMKVEKERNEKELGVEEMSVEVDGSDMYSIQEEPLYPRATAPG